LSAVLTILRVIVQAAVEAGLAFHAGRQSAKAEQNQIDREIADDAQAARDAVPDDRAAILERLRETDRLR
jgi:hypothetical protein